ncbi:hypothetical protein PC129_g1828 [Phytophthora cactorum]|uniref:Uncharacterized protein n=1 Tax=Phytophthora cactorum TaxID=29920 RepID=A0A8T1ELK5_9STRA|nr:hypothetical protein Pcac1_g2720 [Phytophthora cactorum]KAG2843483.1 hypothetical protein PC111_g2332 [Phytophthora cactorum]KAG2845713.1 hypothetical protein PC112_g1750 [Phytophthora cactorum]KAG2868057.1 hypothetical protein PC113_g1413 [Phytophthora cactorum]KAG2928066.1 hypothetical protein PC114_g3289 [Phytophthora cactorum]
MDQVLRLLNEKARVEKNDMLEALEQTAKVIVEKVKSQGEGEGTSALQEGNAPVGGREGRVRAQQDATQGEGEYADALQESRLERGGRVQKEHQDSKQVEATVHEGAAGLFVWPSACVLRTSRNSRDLIASCL